MLLINTELNVCGVEGQHMLKLVRVTHAESAYAKGIKPSLVAISFLQFYPFSHFSPQKHRP